MTTLADEAVALYHLRMEPLIPKKTWLALFAGELVLRERAPVTITVARAIALKQWPSAQHLAPQEAARAWHASRGGVG